MEKKETKRRIVLVPVGAQGHVTPMMHLGTLSTIRSSKLFATLLWFSKRAIMLNKRSEASFKDCIGQLLLQHGEDIAYIIDDEFMYFCGSATKFKLPSVIFSTQSATIHVSRCFFSKLDSDKFLIDMEDPELQEKVVENLHSLRYKDLLSSGYGPVEPVLKIRREVVNKRTASAIIFNTTSCLESSSMSWLQQELGIEMYALGPLHVTASMTSSLLEEDNGCIEWLNKQKPKSAIYISSILGSDGIETLPDDVSTMVSERGYIVKRAPQIEVLRHPAVGGFWSHCGWNSTLESIVEGVPLIFRPFQSEQKVNAAYLVSVWEIGIHLECEVERGKVERAVKRDILLFFLRKIRYSDYKET